MVDCAVTVGGGWQDRVNADPHGLYSERCIVEQVQRLSHSLGVDLTSELALTER
jgi:hypothetical protein